MLLFQPRVDYLGHVVEPGRLSVARKAAEAVLLFGFPITHTQVRFFLFACNVYRRFVKDFSRISRPHSDMARKSARPDFGNPASAQREAIDVLGHHLRSPPILALPKHGQPCTLDCDAYACRLGCTLLQKQLSKTLHQVGYWSYPLKDAERNYNAMDWKCYAVVWAITILRS